MKRYEKIVLEAEKGITFEVSEGTSEGELIIRALNIATANVYSTNYVNPPIPEGWKHVEGEWNNGFVIQDFKGNQFVWIPVGFLDANGTLDGTNFSEKFGRRNYQDDEFSYGEFIEELDEKLRKQWESVQKYGGFYISRYNISKNKQTGEAQSVKGEMPWTNINWFDAMEAAKTFGDGVFVTSHLPFGEEYDSALEWFIKSGKRTKEEIANDSTQWGNFWNTRNAQKKVVKTGTCEEWSTNKIFDLAGNVDEWTQEKNKRLSRVIRGGCCCFDGYGYPVAYRVRSNPYHYYIFTGFRATLFLA
ncbi:MAG: SUMF1/EgtB/PvdO family nonheme iron enzyme [Clostridia bacterium]|nr:SUMF1/EgtB/PvdO family nonheme iron enzyme [Clostridia bacterium]